jgi:tyrosyl-tRNA synthetase
MQRWKGLYAQRRTQVNQQDDILHALGQRGRLKDTSDSAGLHSLLMSGQKLAVYAGFDPTADSLHAGHLASIAVLREFARTGHRTIAVIGTATALVGDPTGRSQARPLLGTAQVAQNAQGVENSLRRAMEPFTQRLEVRRNGEWFEGMGWIEFLREVGSHVPVRHVLALDGVRTRLDGDAMSFLELAYPLMQAFDFMKLSREVGPLVQVGGSDQWGNICTGLDLISRSSLPANQAFGLTHPLLVRSDGTKMGKSAEGAVWLNPGCLDDFGFFRFWRTLSDADVRATALMVADMEWPQEEVDGTTMERLKEELALEMTSRIRGPNAARAALEASRSRGRSAEGLDGFHLDAQKAGDLAGALVQARLVPSRGAALRLARQGGLRVNGTVRREDNMKLHPEDFVDGAAVVSAGKTRHAALRVSPLLQPAPTPSTEATGQVCDQNPAWR